MSAGWRWCSRARARSGAGCGRALYDADPVFRRVVDAVEEEWRKHSGTSLRDACFAASQEELNEVQLAQPVIFMIQCALVELLSTWGVHPDCVIGHSSGEVAAAYASGALSLAEATHLVYHRATLQQRVAGSGRMLAIGLDRPGVETLLEELRVPFERRNHRAPQVEIACENAPANTVVCGKEPALQPVLVELERRGLQNRLIPRQHCVPLDGDGPAARRRDRLPVLPRRMRFRRTRSDGVFGDRNGDAAPGRRVLVVQHPPAGALRCGDGDRGQGLPSRCCSGDRAARRAAAADPAVRRRRLFGPRSVSPR